MPQLPKLDELARASWKFSLDFNRHLKSAELLDEFAAAAAPAELAEWRALHYGCYHLLATAEYEKAGPRAAYAETLMLRLGELNAGIGARAFGAPLMRHFLPREARDPYAFRLLSSPALAQLAAEPEAVPAAEAAVVPEPEEKAAKPRRKKRRPASPKP
jgi:hypothetical protein